MLNIGYIRKEKSITIMDLADCLGIRAQTMTDKLNGTYDFKYSEALKLKKEFFPEYDMEYLYAEKDINVNFK